MDVFLGNNQHVTATTRQTNTKFDRSKNVEVIHIDLNDDAAVTSFAKTTEPFDNVIVCHGVSGLRPIPMLTPSYSRGIFQTNFISKTHLLSSLIKNKKINSPGRVVNCPQYQHTTDQTRSNLPASNSCRSFMKSVAKIVSQNENHS